MLCSGAGNDLLLNAKVRQIGMQIANFVVLVLTLGVLVWYAYETMRLRRAAVDQVEGMAKPCLTIFARLRDGMRSGRNLRGPGPLVCDLPHLFPRSATDVRAIILRNTAWMAK